MDLLGIMIGLTRIARHTDEARRAAEQVIETTDCEEARRLALYVEWLAIYQTTLVMLVASWAAEQEHPGSRGEG